MHRRLYAQLAAVALLPSLGGGCVQMTRHSNMLVFGTATSFGIKVGTGATQVPSVDIGYNRQEAVLVPLVANTKDMAPGTDSLNRLAPCDLSTPIQAPGNATYAVHPCSLVAVNGKALDSYSVLASFGATFDASGGTTNGAKGGLAQYFATGIAAQLLAATGGASVVSVGPAATASALKAPSADAAIEALYGDTAAFKTGQGLVSPFDAFVAKLVAKMELTAPDALQGKVHAFEVTSKSPIKIEAACADPAVCKAAARNTYGIGYSTNPTGFETALTGWTIP